MPPAIAPSTANRTALPAEAADPAAAFGNRAGKRVEFEAAAVLQREDAGELLGLSLRLQFGDQPVARRG